MNNIKNQKLHCPKRGLRSVILSIKNAQNRTKRSFIRN